jgi:endonuclease/exonuclease/phosphatase family metal-dependent hydrolase
VAALTIGSLNLHCGLSAAGRPFDVPSALASLDADLIAVQEAWWTDGDPGARGGTGPGITDDVAVAADKLGAEFIRIPLAADASLAELAIAPRPDRGSWGIGVLSRLPVLSQECISLGQAPGDPVSRAALACTIRAPGGWPLRLVCTHLTHRFTSPAQLYKLTGRLPGPGTAAAGAHIPTVIAGDLNMPRLATWIAAGYAPTVRGRTFPADRPLIQLDHVLVTPDLAVEDAAVLGPLGSDHLPVRARVDLA